MTKKEKPFKLSPTFNALCIKLKSIKDMDITEESKKKMVEDAKLEYVKTTNY